MADYRSLMIRALGPIVRLPGLPRRNQLVQWLGRTMMSSDGVVRGRVGPYVAEFDLRVPMHRDMVFGLFDPRLWRFGLAPYLRPGDVFYDVGASNGYFALLAAARVTPRGQVHAFEPVPANVHLLRSAKRENAIENLVVVPVAVSDAADQTSTMFSEDGPDSATGYASIVFHPMHRSRSFTAQTITLDSYIFERGAPQPDLIKIDAEGAEPRILAGMPRLLSQNAAPKLVIEIHPGLLAAQGLTPEAIINPVREAWYNLFHVTWQGLRPLDGPVPVDTITDLFATK